MGQKNVSIVLIEISFCASNAWKKPLRKFKHFKATS